MSSPRNQLFEVFAKSYSRTSWNEKLAHWEKPASPTEELQIERAANMVRSVLGSSRWLSDAGVTVLPQGSYFNNTNVRQTADQDLRAVHPDWKVDYASGVNAAIAAEVLGFNGPGGRVFADTMRSMRSEIDKELGARFGILNLDVTGNKATRVVALSGSRAPVDVAPAFRYLWVMKDGAGSISPADGVAILGKDGGWTHNFPAQHHANGVAKRSRTMHRFKKVVRSLKRLRDELVAARILGPKRCPSFLIECLTYAVEDEHFLATEADERYDRVLQVVERLDVLLHDPIWVHTAMEINGIKYLFWPTQPWTVDDARAFTRSAHACLLET